MATADAQRLRNKFGRFRILIVGRANAGKTTILQKVCNTTDDPEIYDTKGKKVRAMIYSTRASIADKLWVDRCCRREIHDRCVYIICPVCIHALTDDQRGDHDITNEMVFKSNSDFVFHDSCGFEAGSAEEFEKMMKFISERVHATKLKDRIHAIWQVTSF
jgi:septin family protein